jgi:hypothetical protein
MDPAVETFHVFTNSHSFFRLEEDFSSNGGAYGAETLYLFTEKVQNLEKNSKNKSGVKVDWLLRGVVSRHGGGNKIMGFTGDLTNTFRSLDVNMLKSSDYELMFFQKECMEYLEEYMLVKSTTNTKDD